MTVLQLLSWLATPAPPQQFTISLDTVIISAITIGLGLLTLINASRAKRERAAVEKQTVNFKAFEQAQNFYDITNKRLKEEVTQLESERSQLSRNNRTLERQLNRLEELVRELGGALPDDWNGG
jgi:uncharacterized protein HemX